MDELLLDRCPRQILQDDRVLERPILLWAFERLDEGLGRKAVPEGVTAGPAFSVRSLRARALERVLVVCLDLAQRGHGRFDSASADRHFSAALSFGIWSIGKTLGAGPEAPLTGGG